jgi:hypothetical protein
MPIQLDLSGREYKLLLDPSRFQGNPLDVAAALWADKLQPAIAARLDAQASGKPRHKGSFDSVKTRRVRFWDTAGHTLAGQGYSLRERAPQAGDPGGPPRHRLTLKLRSPDLFVAAMAALPGSQPDAESKFEEDIAPLQVALPDVPGGAVAVAEAKSIRSRFSRSTDQSVAAGGMPKTLGDLSALYPALGEALGVPGGNPDAALRGGPDIDETVVKGAGVDFGQPDGRFALTLWHFPSGSKLPAVAEISFRCELGDGGMSGDAARRALQLFCCLQTDLGDLVDRRQTSKTDLALPPRTG